MKGDHHKTLDVMKGDRETLVDVRSYDRKTLDVMKGDRNTLDNVKGDNYNTFDAGVEEALVIL